MTALLGGVCAILVCLAALALWLGSTPRSTAKKGAATDRQFQADARTVLAGIQFLLDNTPEYNTSVAAVAYVPSNQSFAVLTEPLSPDSRSNRSDFVLEAQTNQPARS